MIDEAKIKLMTHLALYEKNQGKEDLKITEYYKKDFRAVNNLASFIWGTIGYVAILFLAVLMGGSDLLRDDISTNFILMAGIMLMIGYVGFLLIYLIISGHIAGVRYDDAKDRSIDYQRKLTKLLKWYSRQSKRR